MMQRFLISCLFCTAATGMTDYTCNFIHTQTFILHIWVRKSCLFTKAPFALSLFMLIFAFDLSHYYLLLEPNFPPGMTKTNLVYWYFPVALSCIILTNCSELTSAPYTVFSLSVPEASGFTESVCLCVHPYLAPLCMNHCACGLCPWRNSHTPDPSLKWFPISPKQ